VPNPLAAADCDIKVGLMYDAVAAIEALTAEDAPVLDITVSLALPCASVALNTKVLSLILMLAEVVGCPTLCDIKYIVP
jgi:hypothetical protein